MALKLINEKNLDIFDKIYLIKLNFGVILVKKIDKNILNSISLNVNEDKFSKIEEIVNSFLNSLKRRAKLSYMIYLFISTIIFVANLFLLSLASYTLSVILQDPNIQSSVEVVFSALVVFFTIILFLLTSFLSIYRANSKFSKFKLAYQELDYLLIKALNDKENYENEKIIKLLKNINDTYLREGKKVKTTKILKSILANESLEE